MKSREFEPILYIVGMMALFLLQGCDKENEQEPGILLTNEIPVMQVDMRVVIPVHPSSLKYFDYVVCYTDNTGEEYRDTIQETQGGLTVDDWMDHEYDFANSRDSQDTDILYTKNYCYKTLPVMCKCEVNLLPKVSRDSVVSFCYTIPKPYIFSGVIFNSHSYTPQLESTDVGGITTIKLDPISIDTFMSAYGTRFCSSCIVRSDYDGISTLFY